MCFFRILVFSLFVCWSVCCLAEADERPNILFFFADDWGRYASLYTDDPVNQTIQTPNIDRVGREGVCFTNAHVNAPSCTPCRAALFSGQYFYRTGRAAILMPASWDSSIPTFPLLLEKAGYRIGFTYKAWSPGSPADAPIGGDRTRVGNWDRFNNFSQNVTKLVTEGKNLEAAKHEICWEAFRNFETFLSNGNRSPEEAAKPYLYYFGPVNTHRDWERGSGKKLWDMNPDDLKGKMPAFLPDVPEIREDFCDYLGEVLALEMIVGYFLQKLEERGELERTVIVLSGDHGIPGFPRGKCNLYDFGTRVSLLVRWGERVKGGRTVDDFVNLMDLAPTFLEIGGQTPPEVMTGRSLLPLLLSDKSGQIDPTRDYVVTGRERHADRARADLSPYPMRSFRTKDFLYIRNYVPEREPTGSAFHKSRNDSPEEIHRKALTNVFYSFPDMDQGPTKAWLLVHGERPEWKKYWDYAFGKRPAEELYAFNTDPQHLVNLAEKPEFAEIRQTLAARLKEVQTATNDPRIREGDCVFENPPFGGPGTLDQWFHDRYKPE